ncbi:MAG: NHLP bacteriocin system secretion protein [Oscillatoriales cyanobacterium RM1_1_9]|nr:NHLP bacteriocin system secretion protein [Oscillatoriales cyanobacterium RM1_1_9]
MLRKPGDCTIRPVELEQELQNKSAELTQLQREAQENNLQRLRETQLKQQTIAEERINLQKRLQDTQSLASTLRDRGLTAIQNQRRSVEQQLQDAQTSTPELQEQGLNSITEQRNNLQERLKNAEALTAAYQEMLEKRKALRDRGAISEEIVLTAEQDYRSALDQVSQIEAQIQDLEAQETVNQQQFLANRNATSELQIELQQLQFQETELLQKYLENLNQISQIRAQLNALDARSQQLQQEQNAATTAEQKEIQAAQQATTQLAAQANSSNNREIVSPRKGCILELNIADEQILQPDTQIGILEVQGQTPALKNVAYFSLEDGQRIQAGMRVLVTPTTLEGGGFGGVVGEVILISPLPVTLESATETIGNSELAKTLWIDSGSKIEAIAQLQTDPKAPDQYRWSTTQTPDIKLTAGTLTTARITVEERSPITFVLPALRKWGGWN